MYIYDEIARDILVYYKHTRPGCIAQKATGEIEGPAANNSPHYDVHTAADRHTMQQLQDVVHLSLSLYNNRRNSSHHKKLKKKKKKIVVVADAGGVLPFVK